MRMLPQPGTSGWEFPRAATGVRHLLAYAGRVGLDPERLLLGTGLGPEEVAGATEVTAAQELRVVRALAHLRPDAGAAVGATYAASSFGAMGWAMVASRTLGDAVDVALRFIDLSFAFVIPVARIEGRPGDEQVVADLDGAAVPRDVRAFLVARDATAVRVVLDSLVPGGVGADLRLGPERAELRFAARELDRPLARRDATTRAAAEAACAAAVSQGRARRGLADDVRVLIAQQVREGAPAAGVAAALGVGERTLRRRLAAEDTAYQHLLDDVRRGLAGELLRRGLPVAEVAERLGYSGSSALVHAHRRWTGRTPGASR
jgi:AraC-like DNA-binding protein